MELVKPEENKILKKQPKKKKEKKRKLNLRKFKRNKELFGAQVIFDKIYVPEVGKQQRKTCKGIFVNWGYIMSDIGKSISVSSAICIDIEGLVNNIPVQFVRFV